MIRLYMLSMAVVTFIWAGCSTLSPGSNRSALKEWGFIEPHLDPSLIKTIKLRSIKPLSSNESVAGEVFVRFIISSNWGGETILLKWKTTEDAPDFGVVLNLCSSFIEKNQGKIEKALTRLQREKIEKQLSLMKASDFPALPYVKSAIEAESVVIDGDHILFEYLKDGKYRYAITEGVYLKKYHGLADLHALVKGVTRGSPTHENQGQ